VDLYIHSPICLHGVVLNSLSAGTTLPFNRNCPRAYLMMMTMMMMMMMVMVMNGMPKMFFES
jgi:hypothetical protein